MKLKLVTIDPSKIVVELFENNKLISSISSDQKMGSQILLPMIANILKKNKKKIAQIKSIEVATGPGSFTGTRVGVSVANALGYALKIPVNGKKGKIALPKYTKTKFD